MTILDLTIDVTTKAGGTAYEVTYKNEVLFWSYQPKAAMARFVQEVVKMMRRKNQEGVEKSGAPA